MNRGSPGFYKCGFAMPLPGCQVDGHARAGRDSSKSAVDASEESWGIAQHSAESMPPDWKVQG